MSKSTPIFLFDLSNLLTNTRTLAQTALPKSYRIWSTGSLKMATFAVFDKNENFDTHILESNFSASLKVKTKVRIIIQSSEHALFRTVLKVSINYRFDLESGSKTKKCKKNKKNNFAF